jgi:hypothetical protein
MFATTITFNPAIAITVCHKRSFTHNFLIHSHKFFQADNGGKYLSLANVKD